MKETDVASFLEALRTGSDGGRPLAASSAARTVTAVRGFHRFLLDEGLTEADPAAQVRPPQVGRRLPKALTIDEVTRLLDAASTGDDAVSLRDRALLEVLYATGARISEAVGLVVDDLDLAPPQVVAQVEAALAAGRQVIASATTQGAVGTYRGALATLKERADLVILWPGLGPASQVSHLSLHGTVDPRALTVPGRGVLVSRRSVTPLQCVGPAS